MKQGTLRDQILEAVEGGLPARLPWSPRMKLWYNFHKNNGTLPGEFSEMTLSEVEESLSMAAPAREGKIMETRLRGDVDVDVQRKKSASETEETEITYRTPKGSVKTRERATKDNRMMGGATERVEHMIKSPEDYEVVEYIIKSVEFVPTYESFRDYEGKIGDRGLPIVEFTMDLTGGQGRVYYGCPMHQILRQFAGYQQGFVDLHKHKEKVLHLLEVLTAKLKEGWEIILDSPAELVLHGEHLNSELTPPPIYEKYFLPYFQDFAEKLHDKGKHLAFHLDADSGELLELIRDSGCDVADCFATSPLVSVSLEEARDVWGDDITIWGGLPSTIFAPSFPREKYRNYLGNTFELISPGNSFILGVSDNVLPNTEISRIKGVTALVNTFGDTPVDVRSENVVSFLSERGF